MTYAKAAIYGSPTAIADVADLVSCTGSTSDCYQLGSSYRGPVGDLAPGGSATVVFTLRVKDTAAAGEFTLQHQFVGDNYAFDTNDGPVITVGQSATIADVKVALAATGHGGLEPSIGYALTVTNNGPAAASGIQVTATYPAGLQYGGATGCTRVGTTRTLTCSFDSLASGASATARFTAVGGLLALGQYTATVQRTASAPTDPTAANDTASKTCSALTGLVLSC